MDERERGQQDDTADGQMGQRQMQGRGGESSLGTVKWYTTM